MNCVGTFRGASFVCPAAGEWDHGARSTTVEHDDE